MSLRGRSRLVAWRTAARRTTGRLKPVACSRLSRAEAGWVQASQPPFAALPSHSRVKRKESPSWQKRPRLQGQSEKCALRALMLFCLATAVRFAPALPTYVVSRDAERRPAWSAGWRREAAMMARAARGVEHRDGVRTVGRCLHRDNRHSSRDAPGTQAGDGAHGTGSDPVSRRRYNNVFPRKDTESE